jgi:hypothetical protein
MIACFIFYKDLKKYRIGAFLPLCILVCITEIVGSNVRFWGFKSNYFLANIYLILSTILYLYIFFKIFNFNDKIGRTYKRVSIIIMLPFFYNYLFFQGPLNLNTLTISFQQLINILLSCGLLFRLATDEKYFIILKEPYFWMAAGLLIFSLGALVIMGLNQYIRINHLTIKNKALYRIFMPILNVILYSAYTYSFYLCRRKKKLYLPS